jgi:hypothetical protein
VRALETYSGQGYKNTVPLYQGLLAELEAEGQGAQAALARIDEALALATRTEERWTDAFLHCIRGKTTEARPSDRSAIEGAHLRIARGDELGAALARPGQAGYQQVNPLCRISTSPPSEVLLSISEQLRNSSPEVVEPAVFSATSSQHESACVFHCNTLCGCASSTDSRLTWRAKHWRQLLDSNTFKFAMGG